MRMEYHTIREILVQAEQKFSTEDAIRYKIGANEIRSKSYGQLKEDSEYFSLVLEAIGALGNHVAITGATSYPWLVAYLGTVNSGSVAVPLDAQLPAADMCELLHRADATVFVADEGHRDVAELAKTRCPKLKHIIFMTTEVFEDVKSRREGLGETGQDLGWEEVQEPEEVSENTYVTDVFEKSSAAFGRLLKNRENGFSFSPEPDQLCTIMFTSGTTGMSKGVMLTHRNLAENATCLDMGIPSRTTLLSVLPIHHAYCLSMDILKALSLGSIICINDSLLRVAKNLKLFQPDMILMVPLMIETLAKKLESISLLPAAVIKAKVFGKHLHTICSGGAYLNPNYLDFFARYGITILQGYGMTECSPVISTNVSGNSKKGSVGKLMPNCEAKVVEEELYVRGSSVMLGYYKMPEETAETLADGWLKTGDLGYVDEDGFVFLTGRKKNLIITKNGENVSPEELENKIGEHRLVQEVLVRENEGVIEAEIFPDYEYAKKKKISDCQSALWKVIDDYNQGVPAYKKIHGLKVRETEFDKTTSKKIKRF